MAWLLAKFAMFFLNRPQNNSRYTWFIYDSWTASEIKEMNAMRSFPSLNVIFVLFPRKVKRKIYLFFLSEKLQGKGAGPAG